MGRLNNRTVFQDINTGEVSDCNWSWVRSLWSDANFLTFHFTGKLLSVSSFCVIFPWFRLRVHGQLDSSVTFWRICAFFFFCRELGRVSGATNLIHLAAKTIWDRTKGNERLQGQRSGDRYAFKKSLCESCHSAAVVSICMRCWWVGFPSFAIFTARFNK